jgi:hypothetical protein
MQKMCRRRGVLDLDFRFTGYSILRVLCWVGHGGEPHCQFGDDCNECTSTTRSLGVL